MSIPETMIAIEISQLGETDVLKPDRRKVAVPGPEDVLIKIAFAGVNRPDCLQSAGAYPSPKGASDLLGLEVSGEVVAAGSDVPPGLVGEKVMALTAGGVMRNTWWWITPTCCRYLQI